MTQKVKGTQNGDKRGWDEVLIYLTTTPQIK